MSATEKASNNKLNTFFKVVGFLSTLGGLLDTIVESINSGKFSFKIIALVGIVMGIILLFFSNSELRYSIKKRLLFYCRISDPYWIKSKEVRYIYISRNEMAHKKKYTLISKVNQLNEITDKFKWSATTKIEDLKLSHGDDAINHSICREENWTAYKLEFPQTGKHQERTVSFLIENLIDQNNEALPFLSTNITSKTKEVKLTVEFRDSTLVPKNIRYLIYDNYASLFPIFQKTIEYNSDDHKIEYLEKFPIYGYRYVIKWDF